MPVLRWTFDSPVPTLRSGSILAVRTTCPGRLLWRVDDSSSADAPLEAVGDAFEVTLGPFPPTVHDLAFRLFCTDCRCPPGSDCCNAAEHHVHLVPGASDV
ncbi:MAG: hypothetical protein ACOZNI_30575 [Myxococcota bacterium]